MDNPNPRNNDEQEPLDQNIVNNTWYLQALGDQSILIESFLKGSAPNWEALGIGFQGREVSQEVRMAMLRNFSWELYNGQLFDLKGVGEAFAASRMGIEGLEGIIEDLTLFDQVLRLSDIVELVNIRAKTNFGTVFESGYPKEILQLAAEVIKRKHQAIEEAQIRQGKQKILGTTSVEEMTISALNLAELLGNLKDEPFRGRLLSYTRQGEIETTDGIRKLFGIV
jgi:hypothetical protein